MAEKSRVEVLREQKKKIAEQIKAALVAESAKKRKLENHDKILLGVMFQGLIAEGAISSQMFEGAMDKYLTRDSSRERCDAYFEQHRFQAGEIESTDAGLTEDDRTLSVEADFETTTPDEQVNSYLQVETVMGNTISNEGLTDIDIEPI